MPQQQEPDLVNMIILYTAVGMFALLVAWCMFEPYIASVFNFLRGKRGYRAANMQNTITLVPTSNNNTTVVLQDYLDVIEADEKSSENQRSIDTIDVNEVARLQLLTVV